jgi:hypothetical protein
MDWLMYWLITCFSIAFLGIILEDIHRGLKWFWKWLTYGWNYVTGYIYDMGVEIDLTELREHFEEASVQYEKRSRDFNFLSKIDDMEKRHGVASLNLRLADRCEDVAKAILSLQRQLGEIE